MPDGSASNAIVLRPYQWSLGQAVVKVLLYPVVLGIVAAVLASLSGNGGLGLALLVGFPLLALPVAAVVGILVQLNRRTSVTAAEGQVIKRGPFSTTICERQELDVIQYGQPLRGALECQFLRKDGRTAFRITLAPWTALQHDLKGFAAAIGLPLRPNRFVRRFRLE